MGPPSPIGGEANLKPCSYDGSCGIWGALLDSPIEHQDLELQVLRK